MSVMLHYKTLLRKTPNTSGSCKAKKEDKEGAGPQKMALTLFLIRHLTKTFYLRNRMCATILFFASAATITLSHRSQATDNTLARCCKALRKGEHGTCWRSAKGSRLFHKSFGKRRTSTFMCQRFGFRSPGSLQQCGGRSTRLPGTYCCRWTQLVELEPYHKCLARLQLTD